MDKGISLEELAKQVFARYQADGNIPAGVEIDWTKGDWNGTTLTFWLTDGTSITVDVLRKPGETLQ